MSALRVMRDGRPEWLDIGPANGASGPFRPHGSLVSAPPRPAKSAGLTPTQAKLDARPVVNGRPRIYATDEERLAARRRTYRESKARKVA